MSVAFLLKPNYNTINNVHHDFYDVVADNIKNSSLNQALEVSTSVSAPSHVVTGGTDPAQFYMLDATTLATDAPIFKAPVLQGPTFQSDLIGEFTAANGISVQSDMSFEVDSIKHSITGVDELTCGTLHYTTLDPAITPGDPSTWADYPASADIETANFAIKNSTGSSVDITTPLLNLSAAGNTELFIKANTDTGNRKALIHLQSGANYEDAPSSYVIQNQPGNSGATGYQSKPSALSIVSGNTSDLVLTAGITTACNIHLAYDNIKAFTINPTGALAFDSEFAFGIEQNIGNFGTAGQIIASQGDALPPQWVDAPAPGDASAWSEYPATERVDLVTYGLKSATTDVDFTDGLSLNGVNSDIVSNSTSNADSDANTATITIGTTGETYSQFRMRCNSALQAVKTNRGFQFSAGSGSMSSANNQDIVFSSGDSDSVYTANIRFAYDGSKKAYTINKNGALNFDADWNGTSPINEGHFGVVGQVVTSQGDGLPPIWNSVEPITWAGYPATGTVDINGFDIGSAALISCDTLNTDKIGSLNTLNIDAQDNLITNLQTESALNVFYVAKNGKDGSAASVTQPALTISNVISSYAASFYPQQIVIMVGPGVYTETILITSPNVTIIGYSPSQAQNLLTQIAGSVTISCGYSQDLFYSQVGLYNIQVSGLVSDTSSAVHSVNIENCRMAANGRCFWQNSSVDNRTRLRNCSFLQSAAGVGTDPMICFSSGMATLALLDVTAKDNAPVLEFNGTGKLQLCALCTFESTTTSATAAPVVKIAPSTGGAGYTYAFGYSSFSYPSLTPRAFSAGKNSGIVIDSGLNISLIITYNTFNLLLCDATCKVVSDVNKADPTKAATVRFFSNSSTYLATAIDATTKTTLAAVS